MNFKSIIFVFIGGGVGSLIRFIITKYSDKNLISFPLGTSISNLIGCFVIGCLIAYYDKYNIPKKDIYLLVSVGFCGGLTTFSTFILDIFHMLKNENLLNGKWSKWMKSEFKVYSRKTKQLHSEVE